MSSAASSGERQGRTPWWRAGRFPAMARATSICRVAPPSVFCRCRRWWTALKVLIAEDDPISRRLLQSNLEKWGHEVAAARDGAEAWHQFESGEFPIVISDWMMPETDGVELIRRIRAS